jgi:hypothetical protein
MARGKPALDRTHDRRDSGVAGGLSPAYDPSLLCRTLTRDLCRAATTISEGETRIGERGRAWGRGKGREGGHGSSPRSKGPVSQKSVSLAHSARASGSPGALQ